MDHLADVVSSESTDVQGCTLGREKFYAVTYMRVLGYVTFEQKVMCIWLIRLRSKRVLDFS